MRTTNATQSHLIDAQFETFPHGLLATVLVVLVVSIVLMLSFHFVVFRAAASAAAATAALTAGCRDRHDDGRDLVHTRPRRPIVAARAAAAADRV